MRLKGSIFEYDNINHLVAYCNNINSNATIVLVGGLQHNILTLPYTLSLYRLTKKIKIGLVIPQFKTHPNFGIFPIESDIEDLSKILEDISGDIILIGNSTGCQVILLYLNKFVNHKIKFCILQGPVSDTEYFESLKNPKIIDCPTIDMVNFEEVYYKRERFESLYIRNNKEDLFSSYLSDDHYCNLNKHGYKLIFVISGKDEYAINKIDQKIEKVANSKIIVYKNGDHFLTDRKYQKKFINLIRRTLSEL